MKYLVVYGSCGHGHQRAAEYVVDELKARGEKDVTVFDFLNYTTIFFQKTYPFIYKYAVTNLSWLWKIGFDITDLKCLNWIVQPVRRLANHLHAAKLEKFFIEADADCVILTHFLPSEICSALKKKNKIRARIITIVTDTVAHATWINKNSDFFIGFAEKTKTELLKWGIPDSKIKVLGIPIAEKFSVAHKKREYREKYGLTKDLFTILLTSGSFGIGPTEKLLDIINEYAGKIQAIVVCGNNHVLFEKLKAKTFAVPVKAFPFIDFIDELMEASDIIIAKSGGLTMCESLAKEVPLVISRPIPGQETYNAQFLIDNDAAFRIYEVDDIRSIIDSVLSNPAILETKRHNIRTIQKPRATKDIVDFIHTLGGE